MDLERIKKALNDYLNDKNIKLFDVVYHKADAILSVILDEKLNLDELETLSNDLSSFLDQYDDEFVDNYFLDVSNVGLERPIRNREELEKAIGEYIYVKGKGFEYYGDLLSVSDDILKLSIMNKNIRKEIDVDYKEIKKLRYAVKF